MLSFDPGVYRVLFETDFGQASWKFLNSHDSILVLKTATYLKRPALEGLQEQLITEFGEQIRDDQAKRMVGRMTRQIMEHHGYQLQQTGALVRVGDLFTSAAKYKLR